MAKIRQKIRTNNSQKLSNSAAGKDFETYVMSLYEGLGFKVERNLSVTGQQIDVFIRKTIAGVGTISYVVECKFISSGTLGNQHFFDFQSYVLGAMNNSIIKGGILVCNRDFSVDTKLAAEISRSVQIRRQKDLERELFDVSDLLRNSVRLFENEESFSQYIALAGTELKEERSKRVPDVVEFLQKWGSAAAGGLISILGDFGSGKTTVLRRLQYELSKKMVHEDQPSRIPVFFSLRERLEHRSLEEYILANLSAQFEAKFPNKLFWDQMQNGKFVVLLDGFDEISTQVDSQQRARMFQDISPLVLTASPAIMTCRPAYFVTQQEFRDLVGQLNRASAKLLGKTAPAVTISDSMIRKYTERPDYRPLMTIGSQQIILEVLTDIQIDSYLIKREHELGIPWRDLKNELLAIYDIKDLMTRPILLSMIVDTFVEQQRKNGDKAVILGPSGLYETYTELQFERDTFKGRLRRFLTPDQRRYFAHATAISMLENNSLAVSYNTILALIARGFEDAKEIALPRGAEKEQIATDVLVCAFLTRTSDDTFRFVHKSFMEFFVAQYLKRGIDKSFDQSNVYLAGRLVSRLFSIEILRFVAFYAVFDKILIERLQLMIQRLSSDDSKERVGLQNVNTILLHIASEKSDLDFRHGIFSGLAFSKCLWKGHKFHNNNFDKVALASVKFEDVEMKSVVMDSVDIDKCTFSGCELDGQFFKTRISASSFNKTTLSGMIEDTAITDTDFSESTINFRGKISLSNCKLNWCSLGNNSDINLSLNKSFIFNSIVGMQRSKIGKRTTTLKTEIDFRETQTKNSFFANVWIVEKDNINILQFADRDETRGLINVDLPLSEHKLFNIPEQGRIERVTPRFIAIFHGSQRSPGSLVKTLLGMNIEEFLPHVQDCPEWEKDFWSDYLRMISNKSFKFDRL